jgi:hypothetical protein
VLIAYDDVVLLIIIHTLFLLLKLVRKALKKLVLALLGERPLLVVENTLIKIHIQ